MDKGGLEEGGLVYEGKRKEYTHFFDVLTGTAAAESIFEL